MIVGLEMLSVRNFEKSKKAPLEVEYKVLVTDERYRLHINLRITFLQVVMEEVVMDENT